MKVAIVYPEVYDIARFNDRRKEFPPFGILYLSAVLEQNNMEVEVFSVYSSQISLDLRKFDAIAFNIPSSVTYGIIKGVRFNSFYSEDVLIMAGGVHSTIYPEKTLLDLQLHAVGIGAGEETILELLQEHLISPG